MSFDRRKFLTTGIASAFGLSATMRSNARALIAADGKASAKDTAPQATSGQSTGENYPIVDTHTHFYDPTRPQGVPWPSKDDSVLYRAVLPAEFEKLAKPFGVTGTVIVEASSWVEDNQWLLDLADKDPFVLGIVGNLSPGTDEFSSNLSRFVKSPYFRGIRVNASVVKQNLDKPVFVADLKRMIDADLELDVNGGPEMLAIVAGLADRLPKLRIVINHLSNQKIDGKQPPQTYRDDLKAAARYESTFLKVSGYVDNARVNGGKSPVDTAYYFPAFKAAWDAFGEDRVIFGSNWPVSDHAGPYRLIIKVAQDFFSDKSLEARKKFFVGNAQSAYRWPKRT